jgi:hypothetical protein
MPFLRSLLELSKGERSQNLVNRGVGRGICTLVDGLAEQVRVVEVRQGPKKRVIYLFYGRMLGLYWDPGRFKCEDPGERKRHERIPLGNQQNSLYELLYLAWASNLEKKSCSHECG